MTGFLILSLGVGFLGMNLFRYIILVGLILCSVTLGQENDKETIQLWKFAAEQGNATAQYNLGLAYDNGRGVLKNHQEAAKWYRKNSLDGFFSYWPYLFISGWAITFSLSFRQENSGRLYMGFGN